MKKVASIATGRVYQLVNPSPQGWGASPLLMTCDGTLPIEFTGADYGLSERLGLICEECREKVFFTQAKKINTDKRQYIAGAFYSHYSTRQREYCSQRHQSPEGKAAYRQVLAPVARGQWLSRFQRCFQWAVLADPAEPIIRELRRNPESINLNRHEDGRVDLIFHFDSIAPDFHSPKKSAGVVENRADIDLFVSPIARLMTQGEVRELLHRAIDVTLDKILAEKSCETLDLASEEEAGRPVSPEEIERLEGLSQSPEEIEQIFRTQSVIRTILISQAEGGELAQRHCAHMALDFLLAAAQQSLLKTLIIDSLSILDIAQTPEWREFADARRTYGIADLLANNPPPLKPQGLPVTLGEQTEKIEQANQAQATRRSQEAEKRLWAAIRKLRPEVAEYIVQRIATCPWVYIWEAACDYGNAQSSKARRSKQKRGKEREKTRVKKRNTKTRGQGFG